MSETQIREQICLLAKSLFDRGLTGGASGNISVRLDDGSLLVTPTGNSFGALDPANLSHLDKGGRLLSGLAPTKEIPLHAAFYESRMRTKAVVHLHSTHSVALSLLPVEDVDNFLPPLTAYSIMRCGKVSLLPYFRPGDPAAGKALRGLAGKRTSVMLASHGPIVAGADLEAAIYAVEELEETAKLALMMRGMQHKALTDTQIADLVQHFSLEWD